MYRSVTGLHLRRTVGRKWASRGHPDAAPFSLQRDGQNKLSATLSFMTHPWTPRMGTCVLRVDVVLRGLCCIVMYTTVHVHTLWLCSLGTDWVGSDHFGCWCLSTTHVRHCVECSVSWEYDVGPSLWASSSQTLLGVTLFPLCISTAACFVFLGDQFPTSQAGPKLNV